MIESGYGACIGDKPMRAYTRRSRASATQTLCAHTVCTHPYGLGTRADGRLERMRERGPNARPYARIGLATIARSLPGDACIGVRVSRSIRLAHASQSRSQRTERMDAMHAHPATANPMALHGNHGRVSPKVPGLNAQPLMPSIGTDHWRVSATEKRRRNASIRQARPVINRAIADAHERHQQPEGRDGGRQDDITGNQRPLHLRHAPKLPRHCPDVIHRRK